MAAVISKHYLRRLGGCWEAAEIAERGLGRHHVEVVETALSLADLPVDLACRLSE